MLIFIEKNKRRHGTIVLSFRQVPPSNPSLKQNNSPCLYAKHGRLLSLTEATFGLMKKLAVLSEPKRKQTSLYNQICLCIASNTQQIYRL